MKEDELLEKVQASLDRIDSVVGEGCNIHKFVKDDLQKVMSLRRRLSNAKEATNKFYSSFALMLLNSVRRSQNAMSLYRLQH